MRRIFGDGFHVRVQLPLAIGVDNEPEPDIAVVRGGRQAFTAQHPSTAELVIEVADATVGFDRTTKGGSTPEAVAPLVAASHLVAVADLLP